METLFFNNALLPDGWAENVTINVNAEGWITSVNTGARRTESSKATHGHIALPGMPNGHSHAFQRAMAGLAEVRGETRETGDDNFWSWRQVLYKFLSEISPDDLLAISRLAYVEMLEAGFTSVAEFHYLHHAPDGTPYRDIAAMSQALGQAANDSGIGMTFLPVFYAHGGFGGAPATDAQRRFITSTDQYARLVSAITVSARQLPDALVGIAPHSLRAVTEQQLAEIQSLAQDAPIHIHIAEQQKEVEDCIAWSGKRPVEWLLDHVDVNAQWSLIHATHMTSSERQRLANSGAVAGLCPITEANLGDGIFDGVAYLRDGGAFSIGSDSNILISVAEELRMLEYSQRLRDRGRNCLADANQSTGHNLYSRALSGGASAVGRRVGVLKTGYRADIITLDQGHPSMICRQGNDWLDSWIFAGDNSVVASVWVGGKQVVQDGQHSQRNSARQKFTAVLTRIIVE